MIDQEILRALLLRLDALERQQVRYKMGTVTATGPLKITLGGSTVEHTSVKSLVTGLAVSDKIAVLTFGHDLLVVGKIV